MNFKSFTRTEILGYLFLILIYAFGIYFANTDLNYFENVYTKEDGFAEYGTAVMLILISFLSFYRFFKLSKLKPVLWKIGVLGMGLIFLFGAGEEISWGQRIFGVESSEYFIENNAQGETNLHNMVVGETKINKLIFGKILTLILVIYLLILPFLYRKFEGIKKLTDSFAIPVPQWQHTIAFLLATGLLEFMNSGRKWELYELAFGVLFFLIFLNPVNKSIFQK